LTFQVPSSATKNLLEQACQTYEKALKGSVAEKYLLNRGITKEVMTYFRLGYVDHDVDPFPGHEFWAGRLVIPYITPTGIVQMRARAIPDGGIVGEAEDSPKYKSETGASVTMFNTRDLMVESDLIGISEGEIDAITVHMAGIPCIGIPGAENWQKNSKIFSRAFRFRKVIIFVDNDDKGAGRKFGEDVQKSIKGSKIILMPEGYDVNKFYVEFGIDALREKIGLK
jgi:DNA primase